MTDPKPLTLLTEEELAELTRLELEWAAASGEMMGARTTDYETISGFKRAHDALMNKVKSHVGGLLAMARLSLTLQRRVEEAEALRSLTEWVARGVAEDRQFTVRYLGGIEHPWCVRVEDDRLSWSHEENTCTTLPVAVRFALKAAAEEGFE